MSKWIEVTPDTLPLVNQQIFFVVDYRGSIQETRRDLWNSTLNKMKPEEKGLVMQWGVYPDGERVPLQIIPLFENFDPRKVIVKQGWVHKRWPDCFEVRATKNVPSDGRYLHIYDDIELYTHWMPIDWPVPPAIPLDTLEAYDRYHARMEVLTKGSAWTDTWSYEEERAYNRTYSVPLPE